MLHSVGSNMLYRVDWHGFWIPAWQRNYGHKCCGQLLKACFSLQAAVTDTVAKVAVQLQLP